MNDPSAFSNLYQIIQIVHLTFESIDGASLFYIEDIHSNEDIHSKNDCVFAITSIRFIWHSSAFHNEQAAISAMASIIPKVHQS